MLPLVSVLKEESIHWMFLTCYLCDCVALMVSYFDSDCVRLTDNQTSLVVNQWPVSAVLSVLCRMYHYCCTIKLCLSEPIK